MQSPAEVHNTRRVRLGDARLLERIQALEAELSEMDAVADELEAEAEELHSDKQALNSRVQHLEVLLNLKFWSVTILYSIHASSSAAAAHHLLSSCLQGACAAYLSLSTLAGSKCKT